MSGRLRFGRFIPFAVATAVLVFLVRILALAQDVTEPALKAAFIYNFALFTVWPDGAVPNAGPFVLCVSGDAAVGQALEQVVKGHMVAGHSMTVSLAAPAEARPMCHILYVSGVSSGEAARLVSGLRDVPVLTISDVEGFTDLGGIAQFFFEHGQLRFTIHVDSATRARLQISSRLLALAKHR